MKHFLTGDGTLRINGSETQIPLPLDYWFSPSFIEEGFNKSATASQYRDPELKLTMPEFLSDFMGTQSGINLTIAPETSDIDDDVYAEFEDRVNELKELIVANQTSIPVEPGNNHISGHVVQWTELQCDKHERAAMLFYRDYLITKRGTLPYSATTDERALHASEK
jgi:hypothetical protein